jgi:transposase InsO family protein
MVASLTGLLQTLRARFARRTRLEAENLFLRQQLVVLRRKHPGRVCLRNFDRLLLVWLYRLVPALLDAICVVQPETLLRWHRLGFRAYWRWRSRNPGGRPRIDPQLRALIRRMSRENPLWGAPRIHGELQMLGFEVAESTVGWYIVRRRRPPSQGWKTFLSNHAAGIASLDLFVVRTLSFKLLYGLVILRHARRRMVSIAVTTNPTAQWIAGHLTDAFPWDEAPQHLIRDRDDAFGAVYRRRVRAMGIRDHPIAPRSPWQNAHVERLIGSIRRECLDHLIVLGEAHLHRVLKEYAAYYNQVRTHLSLDKEAPDFRHVQPVGAIVSAPILAGLHHQYVTGLSFREAQRARRARLFLNECGRSSLSVAATTPPAVHAPEPPPRLQQAHGPTGAGLSQIR